MTRDTSVATTTAQATHSADQIAIAAARLARAQREGCDERGRPRATAGGRVLTAAVQGGGLGTKTARAMQDVREDGPG